MASRAFTRQAGQLLMAGFDGLTPPDDLRALARSFDLGGAVLFARNVAEPEQVADLAFELRFLGRQSPAWVAVDQEGGRVARLRTPFTVWPPMAALGRADDAPALARRFAGALASELMAVGVTLDFAPVLDVATRAANPAIGDRALAADAARVGELGRVIVEALQAAGLAACGKHFPGHGDTTVDSHDELPIVDHGLDRLRTLELLPFKAAIDAGVAAIMTAHVLVPAIDAAGPATLSASIVTDLLRGELGFDGLVFTDDLDMKAVTARQSAGRAAVAALAAGCDGVLICNSGPHVQVDALETVIRAVESGELPGSRVEDALARQQRAKERFLRSLPARPLRGRALLERLGGPAHQQIAAEMARFA
jgi:beta-N-acetylhexosaminidase